MLAGDQENVIENKQSINFNSSNSETTTETTSVIIQPPPQPVKLLARPDMCHLKTILTRQRSFSTTIDYDSEVKIAIAGQQGYKLINGTHIPLHKEYEDYSCPVLDTNSKLYYSNANFSTGNQVFICADGHGGHEAAKFIGDRIYTKIVDLVNKRLWKLDMLSEIQELKREIEEIYLQTDKEFLEYKTRVYKSYYFGESMSDDSDSSAKKSSFAEPKPVDDGCTLVANILISNGFGKWLVNSNLGDSRTVVGTIPKSTDVPSSSSLKRNNSVPANLTISETISPIVVAPPPTTPLSASTPTSSIFPSTFSKIIESTISSVVTHQTSLSDFRDNIITHDLNPSTKTKPKILFESVDHNMSHFTKLSHIAENGGKFLTPMATFLDTSNLTSPPGPNSPFRTSRVYRPNNSTLQEIGISHKRTLNLTGTLGDVLFKVEPPVMCSKPDTSIIPLHDYKSICDHVVVLAGTDGIYDHLMERNSTIQSQELMDFIVKSLKLDIKSKDDAANNNNNNTTTTTVDEDYDMRICQNDDDDDEFEGSSGGDIEEMLKNTAKLLANRSPHTGLFMRNGVVRFDDALVQLLLVKL